jgi:hypothetical protein
MITKELNPDSPAALLALNHVTRRTGAVVYAGTADPAKVAKRRARNKVARRQRRVNRLQQS